MSLDTDRAASKGYPLLKSERLWGFWKYSWVNVSLAIATWAFLQGGSVATFVGAKAAIASIVIGYGISVLFVALVPNIPSARYGAEHFVTLRSIFGVKGARVVMIVVTVFSLAAWAAILALMVGHAVSNVVGQLLGPDAWTNSSISITVIALLAILVTWVLLLGGPKVIGRVGTILAPALVVLTIVMLILVFTHVSWGELIAAEPLEPAKNKHLAFMLAIELNVGGGLAWWPVMGNLARHTKSVRAAYWPNVVGIFGASVLAAIVGAFAALTLGSEDPTVWMVPLGGAVLGIAALAFIAVANLTSMVSQAYTGISAIIGGGGAWLRRRSWALVSFGFLVPVAVITFFPDAVYNNYGRFVSWIAIALAPLCAVQLVDFFLLRRGRLDPRELYKSAEESGYGYWKGYNPVAFVAVAAGSIAYVSLLNPVSYTPSSLFIYLGASIPSMLVAGILYYLGTLYVVKRAGKGAYSVRASPVEKPADQPRMN